jgi:RNA-directed DNA polymerase
MSASVIFRKLFRVSSLKKTYDKNVQNSLAVGLDKTTRTVFEKNINNELEIINRKVNNGSYTFTPYKQKLISKGAESFPRTISIPTYRDRVTLRSICDLLFHVFTDSLTINIPQIKIAAIKANIIKPEFDTFIKIDITNFYPSIKHSKLQEILKKKIRKKEIINLILKSIRNSTVSKAIHGERKVNSVGIPQGLANSNVLGEIYLSTIDKKYSNKSSVFYTRYVDDILIFCSDDNVKAISSELIEDIEKLGLKAHPLNGSNSKSFSGPLTKPFDFLGYYFQSRTASLRVANRQRFEASTANIFTDFKYKYSSAKTEENKERALEILKWRLNIKITGCIYENKKRGWVFYFSQIDDKNILFKIDSSIKHMIKRFNLETKIHPKTLIKSFHEAKRSDKESHKYIVNFDAFNANQKREVLEIYLGAGKLRNKSDLEVERLFNYRIRKVIEELEEDIQNLS